MDHRLDDDAPADEAYGQVTDPERWRSLHCVAARLVEELVARYAVTRTDGVDLDEGAAGIWPGSPATRLEPRNGGAVVTVTSTFTPFPGVRVSSGHAGWDTFPRFGCDACDEDPDEEAVRLVDLVRDIVAGGFTETRARRRWRADTYDSWLEARAGGGGSGWGGTVDAEPVRHAVPVGATRWPPWTP